MKKKAILIVALLICIGFCFLLWQQYARLSDKLLAHLEHNKIHIGKIENHIFPIQLSLYQIHSEQKQAFSIEKIVLDINFTALFGGNIEFNQIQISNGQFSSFSGQNINLTLKNTALSLQDISDLSPLWERNEIPNLSQSKSMEIIVLAKKEASDLKLQGKLQVEKGYLIFSALQGQWQFAQPLYANVKAFTFSNTKARLSLEEERYLLSFNHLTVNNTLFSKGKIQLAFQPHFIYGQADLLSQGKFNFYFSQMPSHLEFIAQNVLFEQWLNVLQLPSVATGIAQLEGKLFFNQHSMTEGNLKAIVTNGKVKNLNLLAIIAQRFPINFDEQALQNMHTDFTQLKANLHWEPQQIQWKDLQLESGYFRLVGEGVMSPVNQQCDFLLNLGLQEKKYQSIKLPLHFFGNCTSPQYEIKSIDNWKNQLRNLLKQHFSH
ncbi:hypothetical protein L5B97_07660 [Avibacterium sp. 20-15]|uniref:hypothetical protein n=1 Tax=unclassified Avibacterium TaxID=2685287 RepID=UPI002026447F|nr:MULTISPECIES: hypothetical protein [unclassified Avibacterium]MCW9733343.1 hypothetical protein [Avibacterium sp. 20-15]URL03217.1 hypothetical protein L4F93_06350 [Avibacterium sp. 20-132]